MTLTLMRPMEGKSMPTNVSKEIKVNELRGGDTLVAIAGKPLADAEHAVVTSVTRKQKFVYVEREGYDKPMRLALETDVTALRSEPTDEERKAQADELKRDTLASELRKMLTNTPLKAIGEVVDKARERDEDAYDVLNAYNLANLLKTQALYRQALIIRARLRHADGTHVNVEDASLEELLTAYAMWYYKGINRANQLGPTVDPTSRSTSPISNMLDDLDAWAMHEVAYRFMWSGARDDVLARVEIFKAMDRKH